MYIHISLKSSAHEQEIHTVQQTFQLTHLSQCFLTIKSLLVGCSVLGLLDSLSNLCPASCHMIEGSTGPLHSSSSNMLAFKAQALLGWQWEYLPDLSTASPRAYPAQASQFRKHHSLQDGSDMMTLCSEEDLHSPLPCEFTLQFAI